MLSASLRMSVNYCQHQEQQGERGTPFRWYMLKVHLPAQA
jgi:hypothetical protein